MRAISEALRLAGHSTKPALRSPRIVFLAVWAAIALTACPKQYTLTMAVQGNGTTSPAVGSHKYNSGTRVTVTATPAAGWLFDHWDGDLIGSQNPAQVVLNSDKWITAAFVEDVWEPDAFTYDVDLAPDTLLVEGDDLSLLREADLDNQVFTFDAAGAAGRGLDFAAGRPLILEGIAVRRIRSAEIRDGAIVLTTDFIPLNEVIPNGTLEWDYGVEFTPERVQAVEVADKGLLWSSKDATPIEFELEIGGLKYAIRASLDKVVSTFEFTVTKDLGGTAGGRFVAQGEIRRFRSKDRIRFAGGDLQEFDHQLTGMRGEATLELVVAASGDDFVNIELPVTLMKIPFAIGPIPVVLNVKVQFVINAAVPYDGSSRIRTRFTYDSDLGLTFNGISVAAGGRLGGITFGKEVNQTGASNAVAANFGVGFPRVELSIAGDSVVPWAQTAFLIGGSYTFYPACQTADAQFLGAAGYKLGLFGLDLLSGSKTLFSQKEELLRAGDCPDEKQADTALADSVVWTLTTSE